MWDPTGHHPCGGRVRHAVKGVRGNWIEVMGGQDNATSADEADIAMNVQGLHGEPRETRGTTIGNTGNYEKKGQNGNEENGHNGNKENGHGKAEEMLLSLIRLLPSRVGFAERDASRPAFGGSSLVSLTRHTCVGGGPLGPRR